MNNKLYIGNLSWNIRTEQLREIFSEAGEVIDAIVIEDKTNPSRPRSKGFGFVTFATEEEAEKAIKLFNGKEVDGRELVVNVARPQEERPARY